MKKYLLLLLLLIPFGVLAKGYTIVSGDLDTMGSIVKIGDEEFYVIGKEDDTHVVLLSKYNLGVGADIANPVNRQSDNNSGNVKFSDTSYWWDATNKSLLSGYTSRYKGFVNEYEAYVYNEQASIKEYVDNYVEYLESEGTCVTGRLLKGEELLTLGCTDVCYDCGMATYTCEDRIWFNNSSFWLGDAGIHKMFTGSSMVTGVEVISKYSYSNNQIYIRGDAVQPNSDNTAGVRPVIVLDTGNTCIKEEKEEVKGVIEEVKENPKTGSLYLTVLIVTIVLLLGSTIIYIRLRSKSFFK